MPLPGLAFVHLDAAKGSEAVPVRDASDALGERDGVAAWVGSPSTREDARRVARELARRAREAFEDPRGWARATTAAQRGDALLRLARLQRENVDDLATILAVEAGKPFKEAKGEIEYASSYFQWFGEEARRAYGDVIPAPVLDRTIQAVREPVGPVFCQTPFNFPSAMAARKVGPALAAGCPVVWRPSEDVPLSAYAMKRLAMEAGVPDEYFTVFTTKRDFVSDVSEEMCASPDIRKVTFTGSTAVGKQLMSKCASTLKRVSFELGGNAPFVVFADANVDDAVAGLMAGKFRYGGQTCVAAQRVIVQKPIAAEFKEKLASKVKALRLGHALDENTTLGPLIHARACDKVESIVSESVKMGAQVVVGGKRPSSSSSSSSGPKKDDKNAPQFFEPTVLWNVTREMPCWHTEIFGPVAAVAEFETEKEALEMANDTSAGLASYFYTNDLSRAHRVSRALRFGMVGINTGLISTEVAPFGGIKDSGAGREGSKYGLHDYTELKYIATQCVG